MTDIAELPDNIPADPNDPAWHAARRTFIGASDAPKVLGISPWATPLDVWAEKHGHGEQFTGNTATDIGHELEDYVARRWQRNNPGRAIRNDRLTIRHPNHPHIAASVDRTIDNGHELIECKVVGPNTAGEWSDGPPAHVQAQCQVQMAVTGATVVHVCALIIDRGFRWETWPVARNDIDIATIIRRLEQFWADHIEGGARPDNDGDPWKVRDAIARIYANPDKGTPCRLGGWAHQLIVDLKRSKKLAKELAAQIAAAENELMAELGDATDGYIDDNQKPAVTWRPQTRTTYDTTAILARKVDGFTDDELDTATRVLHAAERKSHFRVLRLP